MSLFARAVFVLLVAATFLAFFAAQRLKSAPQVAVLKRVTLHFSPNGDGRRDRTRIAVLVQEDDEVTLAVVDEDGDEVRTLLELGEVKFTFHGEGSPIDPSEGTRPLEDRG